MIDAALTDGVLALVSIVTGFRLLARGGGAGTGGVGLLLVGIAASFGTIRFGGVDSLTTAHQGVSQLAALVGIPMVGFGYLSLAFFPQHAQSARSYVFVPLLVAAVGLIAVPTYGTIIGGISLVAIAIGALSAGGLGSSSALFGVVGAVGVLISAEVVAGEGRWGPMSRIAWFHLSFAASCALLAAGLTALCGLGSQPKG